MKISENLFYTLLGFISLSGEGYLVDIYKKVYEIIPKSKRANYKSY